MKNLFIALLALLPTVALADSDVTAELAAQNTPEGWTAVNLPSIAAITSANTLNITDYGASTASSDNTSAIQAALNDVPSEGGMVVIPAGTWLSGCLQVKSKTVLHLAAGATLKMLDHDTFPKDDNGFAKMSSPFITGKSGASDIIIEGESQETSIIDGQGAPWWDDVETAKKEDKKTTRSAMIRFWQGERYLFRNFRIQNTPNTNITIGQSGKGAHNTAHNITIMNPSSEAADPSHNTDGFPVWTQYVNIYDCEIDTGDDNVVVDSNAQYVHAWNIVCKAGHGMSVGSYTENLHDILYEDIDFQGTETGFRIKSNNDRSGSVYNLTFRNSQMDGVRDPIVITCLYDNDPQDPSKVTEDAVTSTTPDFHDFLFQNITAVNCPYYSHWKRGNSIYIYGRKESYIHDITFDNVQIDGQKGMWMAYCKDINFTNGCNIVNKAGTGDFSMKYEATYTGEYSSSVAINSGTKSDLSSDKKTWYFNDGAYVVTNNNDKTYATSTTSPYLKYSTGTTYTISLPTGIYVNAIEFNGFDNYTTGDSYISSVNGTTYDPTAYVFPLSQEIKAHRINFDQTVADQITFRVAGKQACLAITLYTTDTPTGVSNVNGNGNVNPYSAKKVIENGKIIIIKGNKRFTLTGQAEE